MAVQNILDTTQVVASLAGVGASHRARLDNLSRLTQDASSCEVARDGACALAETGLIGAAGNGDEFADDELVENRKRRGVLMSVLSALRSAMRLTLIIHGADVLSIRQTAEILGTAATGARFGVWRRQRALRDKIHRHLASASAA
ncbi:MAG TPA: hypothetical protein VJN93_18560 [Candidatus Acidoferrum sp.]|nr:hypothetical protein [Candidatus Acidoferrum sp.]